MCIECCLDGVFDRAGSHKLLAGTVKDWRVMTAIPAFVMGSLTGALLYYGKVYRRSNLDRYVPYKPLKRPKRQPEKENENGK